MGEPSSSDAPEPVTIAMLQRADEAFQAGLAAIKVAAASDSFAAIIHLKLVRP